MPRSDYYVGPGAMLMLRNLILSVSVPVLCLCGCVSPVQHNYSVVDDAKLSARKILKEADTNFQKQNYVECEEQLNQTLRLDPNIAWAYYSRACCKHLRGDFEGSVVDCDHSIQLDPDGIPVVYYQRGMSKFRLGNMYGARQDLTTAIKKKPEFSTSYCYRAFARANCNDVVGALDDCERFLKAEPNDRDILDLKKKLLDRRSVGLDSP